MTPIALIGRLQQPRDQGPVSVVFLPERREIRRTRRGRRYEISYHVVSDMIQANRERVGVDIQKPSVEMETTVLKPVTVPKYMAFKAT